jgi:hypothetical protein
VGPETAAGATADAVAGASIVAGMSDGAVSDTGGVLGAGFTSLSVLFTALDSTVAAETGAVAGASVRVGMYLDDAVLSTEDAIGAGSTLLRLILAFSSDFFFVISVGLIRLLVGVRLLRSG